jgi:hypothetical protein
MVWITISLQTLRIQNKALVLGDIPLPPMKSLHFICVAALAFMLGCGNPAEKTKSTVLPDTPKAKTAAILPDDTVTITIDSSSRADYKWGQLKNILKAYPALNLKHVSPPASVYTASMIRPNPMNAVFTSEVGQDNFYGLYTYFLKKKLDTAKYTPETRNLVKIYRDINNIYSELAQGGTYYIHQDTRLPAYAWYAVYLGRNSDNAGTDISAQKAQYLAAFKHMVNKKVAVDTEIPAEQKSALKAKLSARINDAGELITNSFYLKAAQDFQSAWYKN